MLVLILAAQPAANAAEPGLTGQWHLDAIDGSGASSTTPDGSGGGQPGTFTGTPTLVPGRFGNALNVGAGNGWMNVTRPAGGGAWAMESQRISFTVWIKQQGFPGVLRYVAGKGALGPYPTCGGSSWAMYTGYNGKAGLAFYVKDAVGGGTLSPQLDPSSSVWDGAWHAVTGTYDGTAVRLYLDGAQVGSGTPFTGSIDYADAAQDNFTLGTYPDRTVGAPCGVADWPGPIDEPRAYDRALTQAEITKLHDPAATTPPDLTPATTTPPTPTPTTPTPTPRPPFDIFQLPARNLVAPEIQSKPQGTGKRVYSCTYGEWEGLADDPKFVRSIYSRELGVVTGKRQPDKFVTSVSGVILSNTSPRKVYYCVVKAAARTGGTVSATGPLHVVPDVLLRGPVSLNPKIIGDLRIRGIDVFQLVQPTSGAAQYSFNGFPQRDQAFPAVCGGGTPVSLVAPACAANGAATQQARYNGVLLDADKPTSAVVYLDRKPDGLTAHSDAQLQVKLRMTAGARVKASLTQTTSTTNLLSATSDAVTAAERGDERYGVRFEIPQDWVAAAANGSFELQATVTTVGASSDTRQCQTSPITILTTPDANCTANDTYKVTDVYARFLPFSGIFRSIGLFDKNKQTLSSLRSPQSALASAQTVLPGGEHFQVSNYVAGLPIDPAGATSAKSCPAPAGGDSGDVMRARLRKCASANVYNTVRAWVASGPATDVNASPTDGFHVLLALHNYQYSPGWTEPGSSFNTNGVGYWGRSSNQPYLQLNDGTVNRPLTAATHELVHAFGVPHAGVTLSGLGGDPSCGGDRNGQVGEPWPSDNAGRLQGVAFDPATGNRTLDSDDVVGNVSQPLWDLMSYCTGDPTAWISPRNWNRAFAFMVDAEDVVPTTFQVPIRRAARAVAAQAPSSGVVPTVPGAGFAVGIVIDGQARITGLEPADPDHVVPAGDSGSALRVRGIGANGQTLADVGARMSTDSETGATTFIAPVPKGSSAVELVSGGAVVDRREKGRAPSVTLLAPAKKGVRVRKALEVRYRASDPDGGDLTASVEFSQDGRTKWRTVQRGPATGRAVLPAELLRTATAGRVRIKVTDGFSTAEVTSVALRVDGRPPTATIVRPGRSEDVTAAAPVVLLGQGADEAGKRLRGRALTWYAGTKRLGSGERLKARLPAGRITLRLVVQDGSRRTTTARRVLRIDPVALELRTLRAGAAKAGARRVSVTVATNVAATLRGGGINAQVGPKPRTLRLTLPAKPASGLLRLPLRLTPAGGGTALRPVLIVLRG